ncbi:MAG TPA: cupin domain-containing protein [Stellaceae bacterium]|nr:cupin domain-containing protein [Stellaceae bacterium]
MDKIPLPLSLAAALAVPLPEGRRSAEIFVDGDLEIRLYAPKGHDPQTPHDRDELYVVAAGRGNFRFGDRVEPFAPGALLYVAANETHRFEDFSDDFAAWVVFYGDVKSAPPIGRTGWQMSLAEARRLTPPPDRASAEILVDGDVEVRFAAPATQGMQVPHDRDEFYVVASGSGRYRIGDTEAAIGPGDLLFAAAHAEHGFVERSDDFAEWIVFYGPVK